MLAEKTDQQFKTEMAQWAAVAVAEEPNRLLAFERALSEVRSSSAQMTIAAEELAATLENEFSQSQEAYRTTMLDEARKMQREVIAAVASWVENEKERAAREAGPPATASADGEGQLVTDAERGHFAAADDNL